MFGNTIAEFFGQILIGFTRSVAEHYSFDEIESHSELLGCYALDDTGKEWYCQPVGELEIIYQEYNKSEATASDYLRKSSNARLINACSTEDNEQTHEEDEDRAVAWQRLRPEIFQTV